MRLPFLILAPVCVFLGIASAVWEAGNINWFHAFLAMLGGIAAHISVNTLNEYFDFKSGLDFRTQRTPFSGGSGTLPDKPEMAKTVLITSLTTAGITGLLGVYFMIVRGPGILPLGLVGLLVIFTYTSVLNRNLLLCLIAPGLGFGTLMVMGTHFVLTGSYSWPAFFASLVPFFLVSNLLLLNQFPDAEADRSVGRRHLPIVAGNKVSAVVYGAFLLLTYITVVVGGFLGYLPWLALLGLLTVFAAVPTTLNVYRNADNIEKLMPSLGMNVIITMATPILMAVGLLIA